MNKFLSKINVTLAVLAAVVLTGALLIAPRKAAEVKADSSCSAEYQTPIFNPYPQANTGADCTDYSFMRARVFRNGQIVGTYAPGDITAQPGDEVDVVLYIHNGAVENGDPNVTTARGIQVSTNANMESSSSHTISAQVTANNVSNSLSGSMRINTSGNTTLEVAPGSEMWAARENNYQFQNFSGIINSTKSLPDQLACFDYVRAVYFSFKVVEAPATVTPPVQPPTPVICVLSVNANSIPVGGQVTFSPVSTPSGKNYFWYGSDNYQTITPVAGGVTGTNQTYTLNSPKTYIRYFVIQDSVNGNVECTSNTVTVVVVPPTTTPTQVICVLSVSANSVTVGGQVTFVPVSTPSGKNFIWYGTDDGQAISPIHTGVTGTNQTYTLNSPKTYVRYFKIQDSANGSVECTSNSVTVVVNAAPQPNFTATATATANANASATCPNGATATASASASATATATSNISQQDAQNKAQSDAQGKAQAQAQAAANANASVSCPGAPAITPVVCVASATSILVGHQVTFRADHGNGTYNWTVNGGTVTSSNAQSFTSTFHNVGNYTATVSSNGVSSSCNVNVNSQGGGSSFSQLSITKNVRNINSGNYQNSVTVNNNDIVQFEIMVSNSGNQTANNVRLNDNLPGGLSLMPGTVTVDGITVSDSGLYNNMYLGSLSVGQQKRINFQARVNTSGNTSVQNIAYATSDNSGNVQASAWVYINGSVLGGNVNNIFSKRAFNETKNVNATTVNASREDYIVYTLTVTNSGNTPANNFIITDDLSQVLPYADIVDNGGGSLNGNSITYPGITVPAGGSVSRSFKVRVKFSLASNLSYTMSNTYGNTVTIRINNPQILGEFIAPKTGAETMGFTFAGILTAAFLAFRQRKGLLKLIFT